MFLVISFVPVDLLTSRNMLLLVAAKRYLTLLKLGNRQKKHQTSSTDNHLHTKLFLALRFQQG